MYSCNYTPKECAGSMMFLGSLQVSGLPRPYSFSQAPLTKQLFQ